MDRISWDDLKVLNACSESGSFRVASRRLNLSSSTVARRIERLERVLEVTLFHRLPEGIALTPEGTLLVQNVHEMSLKLCELGRRRSGLITSGRGHVRVGVTEGLGSYWVMPHLVEFQRINPGMSVELQCAMESIDVLRLQADMAIQFIRPDSPELIIVKLGRLHIYPFAAQTYLDAYGTPKTYDDIPNHRLVEQVAPQIDASALAKYFRLPSTADVVGIRTNTSTAHLYAIEKGAGIGGLPTFAMALGAPVVPVEIGEGYGIDLWLTYHPEVRRSPHKSATVEWLRHVFDPSIYPWFRDEFIHPRTLATMMPAKANAKWGTGFLATDLSNVPRFKHRKN